MRYERKCEWVFLFWTQCIMAKRCVLEQKSLLAACRKSHITHLQSSHDQPTWLPTQSYLCSVYTCRTHSLSLVTLARPSSVSSSLQITNRSFTYASPHLWNQLPSSFRQPHSVYPPWWWCRGGQWSSEISAVRQGTIGPHFRNFLRLSLRLLEDLPKSRLALYFPQNFLPGSGPATAVSY